MKFPLSLDLSRETLAENLPGQVVIDADQNRIMLVYPDSDGRGRWIHAQTTVDMLNALDRLCAIIVEIK